MPRQFKRLSHSLYECKYHLVFCPKYRYRVLTGEVGEYVKQDKDIQANTVLFDSWYDSWET